MLFSSSYATIGLDGFDYVFFLGSDYVVGRLLGIITLADVVVMGGLLCMTSTLVCSVYLCGGSVGFYFV